ncbi:MAG: 50S ribosomal protein L6 [Alphaproteobacteria bacterium GM7ARS4]|nr:50S ribosomal protein L6 [Alphaproteobacteria bacterium GM7ARS4]
MSRTGKAPIFLSETTQFRMEGHVAVISDSGREMRFSVPYGLNIEHKESYLHISPQDTSRKMRMMWGTTRACIANMVTGVKEGFQRVLLMHGVGYRAQMKGKDISLQLGYSHEILFPIPDGITAQCPQPTEIVLKGADKQRLGQIAAEIRALRPPEPYKGKGIRYQDEFILRKEGKKKK